jgi:hypothetical protein
MPSSSAPCQPASQSQPAGKPEPVPASQVQTPDLQKICAAEGGTSTRRHTQGSVRGRGGWSGEREVVRGFEGRRGQTR